MGKGKIRQAWGMGCRSHCSSGPSFMLRVGRAQDGRADQVTHEYGVWLKEDIVWGVARGSHCK